MMEFVPSRIEAIIGGQLSAWEVVLGSHML